MNNGEAGKRFTGNCDAPHFSEVSVAILAWSVICALVVLVVMAFTPKQRAKVYLVDSVQVLRAEKARQDKEKKQ